jgi:hypothetical protein
LEHNERLPDELTLLAVFVPALRSKQEPAAVERLLALARRMRTDDATSPAPPEPSRETAPAVCAARQPTRRLTNLPHRLTSLIGRAQEVIALQPTSARAAPGHADRGGGVGKSRLALALGQAILDFGVRLRRELSRTLSRTILDHSRTSLGF